MLVLPPVAAVGKPRRADLSVSKVSLSAGPALGATVKLRAVVRNAGRRPRGRPSCRWAWPGCARRSRASGSHGCGGARRRRSASRSGSRASSPRAATRSSSARTRPRRSRSARRPTTAAGRPSGSRSTRSSPGRSLPAARRRRSWCHRAAGRADADADRDGHGDAPPRPPRPRRPPRHGHRDPGRRGAAGGPAAADHVRRRQGGDALRRQGVERGDRGAARRHPARPHGGGNGTRSPAFASRVHDHPSSARRPPAPTAGSTSRSTAERRSRSSTPAPATSRSSATSTRTSATGRTRPTS